MKRKIRVKNIVVISSIITALGLLVVFDHQRVTNDFINIRADLMGVRLGTITENNSVIVRFNGNEKSVLDFKTNDLIEAKKYPTRVAAWLIAFSFLSPPAKQSSLTGAVD